MHPGVQQNINSIIKALTDNYNLNNVYLEGAYETVNTNWLTNIVNENLKKSIIKELIKDGKLTGAEIYSINNNKQNFILPIEDKNLHKENIKRLAKILDDKPNVSDKLDKIEKELSIYQKKYLSANNKKFTEIVQKHDLGKLDTGKFYKLLFAYLKKNATPSNSRYGNIVEMSVDDYPNINRYLKAYQLQNRVKLKELSKDLKALMKVLKKELSYSEYNNILTNTNNFSDIDALIASLVVLPSEYKQKYATKQLQNFIEAAKLYKEINPVELVNEEHTLIEQIRAALSKNKAELEISFLTDFFKYFKDFMIANISADNRHYFSEKKDKFINLWNKYSFYNKPMQELVTRIPFIDEYYNVNDYRNEVFIEKISIENNKNSNSELPVSSFSSLINGKKLVVVITGGYHTKGLTDLLFKNNISYAVITPTVSGGIENTYKKYETAVKEEALIASQTLASAAISLVGLEQSYVIELLRKIQTSSGENFNLEDLVNFIKILNETKEQKINYEYDKQKQILQLSDDNTQIIITNSGVTVNLLKKSQNGSLFDTKKILNTINENFKILSSNFGQDIFYPNMFKKLNDFETFLIERNLMPAISNGLIYEIDNDEQFKEEILKQDEDALIKLAQKTYSVQYETLAKYYREKGENIENVYQNENNIVENGQEVLNEMGTLNSKGQLLAEEDNIDYVNEFRQLENFVKGKLNYKPRYAVYAAGGRIGQPDVWKLAERQDVELSMITVSPRLSREEIPYSVSHDGGLKIQKDKKGVHGDFDGTVQWYEENELTNDDISKYKDYKAFLGYLKIESNKTKKVSKVAVFQTYNPEDVNFDGLLVLNTSGKNKTEKEAEVFLKQGADMVVLSAPGEMPTYTNGTREAYKGEKIFSGASCSTNALQSVLLPISENGRIQAVRFGGAHSRTNSEGDKEYGFEPHSSGAFKATVKLPGLQYLKGQIIGNVNRISSVMDGSILDVTIQLEEPIKGGAEEVNKLLFGASLGKYKGVLGYELLTSNVSDIVGRTEAGIVQADQTMVSDDGKTVQLAVWYDNEVGYANQYLDLSYYAGMYGTMKDSMLDLLNKTGIDTKSFENKDVTLKEIYKVFRNEVMTNNAKMAVVKTEAENENEMAKGILNLTSVIAKNNILTVPEGEQETFVSDDLLANAKIGGYAIGAYNMNNLDQLQAIVEAATSGTSTPLMIEISEGAFGYSADNPVEMEKFNYLVETYKMIAATMPGAEMILHLDHAKNIDVAKKAIDMGFSSVMLDYSKEEISKNKQATKELVEYAHERGARVEAEIGAVDLGDQGYTTPEQALDFVQATNVDSLAIAVGTAHGANKNNPQLQFMLIAEIAYELYKNGIKTPLVLHGASAVPQELIKRFNAAGGKKENASGVPIEDTQAAVKWKTLFEAADKEIGTKAKKDKSFDYNTAKNKLEEIKKEITDKDMLEQGVISKVNVATDVLVAGAVGIKESIKEGKGVNHIAEQKEAMELVGGKMVALGSHGMAGNTEKNKQKITFPAKAIKPVKELQNKQNVKQYNIGSVEEIQAVMNNSKDGDNIIFTIDEDTAKRFNFTGYRNKENEQQYNSLVFAIEVAAQNNKNINIAVNLINSNDIDKTLTNIIKKTYQYNAKEGAFELKLDNLNDSELIYLTGAINNGEIMNLREIADDITEQFHKYQNDKHDVRDWGKQYRNIIWQLLENINNGSIENYVNRENSFETIDEVSDEIGQLNSERQEIVKEDNVDYVEELRVLEDKVTSSMTDKPGYAVYAALGRIGQPVVWKLAEREDVEFNILTVSPRYVKDEQAKENLLKELAHDSGLKVQTDKKGVHGDFDGTMQWYKEKELSPEDKEKYKDNETFKGYIKMVSNKTGKVSKVAVFGTYNPEEVNFDGQIVLNTSGKYKNEEEAEVFIKSGAEKVVLSAPGEMATYTNGTREAYKGEKIFSGASCSTNALQSVLLPISEAGRIESVRFGGAHSRTNSEGDKEYGFEPHSSGAFKATVKLPGLQYLKGQIIGNVNRISSVMDGSILDVTIQLEEPVKGGAEEVNSILRQASQGKYKGVLGYSEESLKVADIVGRPEAGIVQADQTMVSEDGKTVQLAVWYDNEVGYANQYLDLSVYAGKQAKMKEGIIDLMKNIGADTKKIDKEGVNLKEVYKVLRQEVISDKEKMNKVKEQAEKGNYFAQAINELNEEMALETTLVEQKNKKVEIKVEKSNFDKIFKYAKYVIKSTLQFLNGEKEKQNINLDLIYIEDSQNLPQQKRYVFDRENNKITLYISLIENADIDQLKQMKPSGIKIDDESVQINKDTGVIYTSSKEDIDFITSNISVMLNNFLDIDTNFSVVVADDKSDLSINDDGVIKTSLNFVDNARTVVNSLTNVMNRNLVVMLEGNRQDITSQLDIMEKIGNKTVTLPAKYFENRDSEVIKKIIAKLQQYGVSVITEYSEDESIIKNAYQLGFAGHVITSVDNNGIKRINEYKNYSLNEDVTNFSVLSDIASLKNFTGIKSSNDTVFIRGEILKTFVKGRDFLQVREFLNGLVTNFVKFFNDNVDENLIENFVFELPKENIPELSENKIWQLKDIAENNDVYAIRAALGIDDINELVLFENKVLNLCEQQNKDKEQMLLCYYETLLKAAQIKNKVYKQYPLGFKDRNIKKLVEKNALVKLNETEQKEVDSIIEVVRVAAKKMNAADFESFVYELAYSLDGKDIQTAQKLLEGIDFDNEIKEGRVAKTAVFELLILFADKANGDINFEKENFDDIKNVVNILTAA